MKAKRPHRVPLSRRTVEILDAARTLGDGRSLLVFPGSEGAPLPEKALRRLLQNQQIAAVPHGFRSTFRDWAAEETNHPREVIEGGAGPHGAESGRGGVRAIGPVRAPAAAHGRLGRGGQPAPSVQLRRRQAVHDDMTAAGVLWRVSMRSRAGRLL